LTLIANDLSGDAAGRLTVACVIGLPGPLAGRCAALLSQLAALPGRGSIPVVSANSLSELGQRLLTVPTPAVLLAERPESSLLDALVETERRFLVVLESPRTSLDTLMSDRGMSAADAIRMVANGCAAIAGLAVAPGALVIRPSDAADNRVLRDAIAAHFGMVSQETPELGINPSLPAADIQTDEPDWKGLIEESLSGGARGLPLPPLAGGALDAFGSLDGGGLRGPLAWARDLLTAAGSPQRPASGAIDITGASRCLVFGPYIRLPRGSWSCALLFGCSAEAVGLPMIAEVFAGNVLATARFTIEDSGIFEIEMPFENPDPDALIEVRLFNGKAAFEGRIAIGKVTMTPLQTRRLRVN
jgi:hypothetical protein